MERLTAKYKRRVDKTDLIPWGLIDRLPTSNLLTPLAFGISALGIFVWLASMTKADFWADDFSNLTKYGRTFGPILETDGKLIINLYWFVGSYFFGSGSVIPYLLLNFLVFVGSIFILTKAAISRGWHKNYTLLILTGLFGSGTIFAFLIWSSNIVHLASLFGLSCAIYIQEFARKAHSSRLTLLLASVIGFIWTFTTLSNPLYLAVIVLGLFFVHEQYSAHLVSRDFKLLLKLLFLNLFLPIVGFVFLSYPRVTKQSAYDLSGNEFILDNIQFYITPLANIPYLLLLFTVFLIALGFALIIELKKRNFLPLILVSTALGVTYPILIQGQQRGIHYFSIPVILLVSSVYSMKISLAFISRQRILGLFSKISMAALIVLIVASTTWTRAWYTTTPFGQPLTEPRKDISKLVKPMGSVCLSFKMPDENRNFFIGGMGGTNGFLLPPINAGSVRFEHLGECDVTTDSNLDIELNPNNTYLISRTTQ
jgi:hypothetical protein